MSDTDEWFYMHKGVYFLTSQNITDSYKTGNLFKKTWNYGQITK